MILEIPKEDIVQQLLRQLQAHFLLSADEEAAIGKYVDKVLARCENNFLSSNNKYFTRIMGGVKTAYFNPYHSVQYMIFLYYLSHEMYVNGESTTLCDKVYYLNKVLNGVDLFYAINLPDIFHAEHPLGSVMGRAKYGNHFFFYQGCTVGGTAGKDGKPVYPELGENVWLFANSSILGRCKVGDNVKIGAGALVKNEDIPSDCIVFGQSPNLIFKKPKRKE